MMHKLTKVLLTTDTSGGVWTYTLELCRYFDLRNIQVALVVTGTLTTIQQRNEILPLKNITLHEREYKLEWMDDPWRDIDRSGEWLLEIENNFKPDIIHLNSFSYGSLKWQAPVIVVGHSCKLSWWKSVKNGPPPPEWSEYYLRVYNGLHAADFVAAPSRFMLQNLNIIYGDFLNQIVVYNGRTKNLFNIAQKKSELIVTAGRIWDEAKNIKSVVDGAPFFNWKVAVAGNNISPINKEETKTGNLIFKGVLSIDETVELFSSASIFLLPVKYEPFGLTPLEAAMSGCALVLGKTASMLEIWEDAAIYVTSGDIEEMAFVVNYLIEHRDLLNSYAIKAYTRAQSYTSEKMGEAYISLYRRVIRNKIERHKAVV